MAEKPNFETFKLANELAFKWFEAHADHRLRMLNFFLLIAGVFVAGYFGALQAKNHFAAIVVSLLLVFIAFCFKQLDRRTAQHVKLGEDYLKISLADMARELGTETVNFVTRAETKMASGPIDKRSM
jgi:hypothetical protein